ncbi:MAG TPA: ABC transporter permease [Acidimicrobiales bacterium]|nr:ABC transporter permease [Acidimicrobiales bacterium]
MAATLQAPPETLSVPRRVWFGASDVAVLTKRNLIHLVRVPALIVFTAIQPVMFTLLFRYVFGGAIHTSVGAYVEFLIPGIIVQTAAFGSFQTAIALADELSRGMIDRFRSMPIARSAVVAGRLASDTLRITVTVVIILGVGYAVGFRIHTGPLETIAMVLFSVGFGVAICCVSACIGLAVKDQESVQAFGLIWLFPLVFASGVFVPVATLPAWLAAFARNNPVTLFAEGARSLSLGTPAGDTIWLSVVWMVAIVAVFGTLAVRAYRRAA